MVLPKNSIADGGFLLMARTETEGGSNWLVAGDNGKIATTTDLTTLKFCTKFEKVDAGKEAVNTNDGNCKYSNKSQLRYIYMF